MSNKRKSYNLGDGRAFDERLACVFRIQPVREPYRTTSKTLKVKLRTVTQRLGEYKRCT